MDTQGHLLHIKVHAANVHDTIAGGEIFAEALRKFPTLQGLCADAGYRKTTRQFVTQVLKKQIDIHQRRIKGWSVITQCWVVERTFAWFNGFRRLSKDYEKTVQSATNTIIIAHYMMILNRIYDL